MPWKCDPVKQQRRESSSSFANHIGLVEVLRTIQYQQEENLEVSRRRFMAKRSILETATRSLDWPHNVCTQASSYPRRTRSGGGAQPQACAAHAYVFLAAFEHARR